MTWDSTLEAASGEWVATVPGLCRGPFADMEPTNPRHKGDAVATSPALLREVLMDMGVRF